MECEYVQLKTKDGVELYGAHFQTEKNDAPAVVLLHMMPATKESWDSFQEMLVENGFQSLAIDLRGHGESVFQSGELLDYQEFSPEEHRAKIYDVEAATEFFIKKGISRERIAFIGASIGANLSLWQQVRHRDIKASVLLSPGLSYKGIMALEFAEQISPEQSVFVIAAQDDDGGWEYPAGEMAEMIYEKLPSKNKKIQVVEGTKHGTGLFAKNPGLEHEIIKWLTDIYL